MTGRPIHLPSCRCGGSGLVQTETKVETTGSAPARTYTALGPCPDGPTITDDQWTAWQTRQLAAGRRTQTTGGVINRQAGLDAIAAARAALPARPATETTT